MPTYENLTPNEIDAAFLRYGRVILTFIGFADTGYEDTDTVRKAIEAILDDADPDRTIVNAGATPSGIGLVYEVAKAKGFTTTGITSMQAKRDGIDPSPFVDHVFYVDDPTWGGFMEGSHVLSPTSQALVSVSDRVIAIGGGPTARDELVAALEAGKPYEVILADMNHALAIARAREHGDPAPADFQGALGEAVSNGSTGGERLR